ncbi:MAG: TIGR04086 family membrane protein [Clostridia bacterium]|nr:TIGR04086 family membrane protein [Clostridia bacterium]
MKGCIFLQTGFLKNSVKGFLVAILSSGILLLLFGWICYTREDPSALSGILGRAALYISAFLGGFFAARFNREKGLLSGLATGGAFMLFVALLSMLLRGESEPIRFMTWVMFLLILLVGTVGGYLGVPSGKRRKRKNKKKR